MRTDLFPGAVDAELEAGGLTGGAAEQHLGRAPIEAGPAPPSSGESFESAEDAAGSADRLRARFCHGAYVWKFGNGEEKREPVGVEPTGDAEGGPGSAEEISDGHNRRRPRTSSSLITRSTSVRAVAESTSKAAESRATTPSTSSPASI